MDRSIDLQSQPDPEFDRCPFQREPGVDRPMDTLAAAIGPAARRADRLVAALVLRVPERPRRAAQVLAVLD